jgi:hypothetical protein
MDRRAKILAKIDVARARGLEIGPLNRPIVTRDMGPIEYIDRASREELQRWYSINAAVNTDDIVEVDHVWGDQTLFECVGGQRVYDYLVASHVIEHVPDLFGWLGEIASVVADGGIASFVVPDKRFTFDVLRRTSSESEMVDAFVRSLRRPEARQIFDHFNGFRDLSSEAIQNGASPSEVPPTHPARELLALCRRAQENGQYIDTHCWVFTPHSFIEGLDLASRLGLLPFEIAWSCPTAPGTDEFFVSLRRLPDDLPAEVHRAAFAASREAFGFEAEGGTTLELDELMGRVRFAEDQAASLRRSTSWRITAPLRQAVTTLRRLKQRIGA